MNGLAVVVFIILIIFFVVVFLVVRSEKRYNLKIKRSKLQSRDRIEPIINWQEFEKQELERSQKD